MYDFEFWLFAVVVFVILLSVVSFLFHKSKFVDVIAWPVTIVLSATSMPQFVLNWQRGSVEGLSWAMFSLIWLGMVILFLRSLKETNDVVIRLNYGIGTFVLLLMNCQIVYFRYFA